MILRASPSLPFLCALLLSSSTAFVINPDAFANDALERLDSTLLYDTSVFTDDTEQHFQPEDVLTSISSYAPSYTDHSDDDDDDTPLPLLIWHGLGDSADADGIKDVAALINEIHPGTYVRIVSLGADGSSDRSASFFGNVTLQSDLVCESVRKDRILMTAPGLDMLGFSQGGQFLRGLVETCDVFDTLKVRTLLTFGAQHNGIQKFQRCKDGGDWVCRGAEALVRSGGVWSDFVQGRIVPAQYFRDPEDLEKYVEHSHWLAGVNNERVFKNETYKQRLAEVEKFVMVLFEGDETVVPKESGWFAEVNSTTGEVTPLKERNIYKEDWIGLKEIDKKGGLVFEKVKGAHMALGEKDLERLFGTYFGPMTSKVDIVSDEQDNEWAEEL